MCSTNEAQETSELLSDSYTPLKNEAIHIDEALQRTRFGKFNYFLVFVCGLILSARLLESCGISYVLPVSQCDLNLTVKQKGILSSVSFVGFIFSLYFWGYLADTKGRKRIIQPTLFAAFCLSVASSLTNNFYVLTTLRFLNGFCISAPGSTVFAYLGELHGPKQRDRVIVVAVVIQGVSGILLPLLAWGVINQDWMFYIPLLDIVYKPWRLFFVICGLPGLIAAILLMLLPESPKFVLGQGKQIEAIEILKKIHRWNNGSKAMLDISEINQGTESIKNRRRISDSQNCRSMLKSIGHKTAPLFQSPHLIPILLFCTIQFLLYSISTGMFMWFPDILNRIATQNLYDERIKMCEIINMSKNVSLTPGKINEGNETACVTKLEWDTLTQGIAFEMSVAIGLIVVGYLINKIRKSIILIFVLTLSGLGGIVSVLTDIPIVAVYSFMILLNGCLLAGSVISAAYVRVFPTDLRAMAISVCLTFGRIGSFTGSNVYALLIDSHCNIAFLLSGSSMLVAGALTLFIPKIHQKPMKSDDKDGPRNP